MEPEVVHVFVDVHVGWYERLKILVLGRLHVDTEVTITTEVRSKASETQVWMERAWWERKPKESGMAEARAPIPFAGGFAQHEHYHPGRDV